MRVLAALLLGVSLLSGCASTEAPPSAEPVPVVDGRGDAVVIAVVDSGFNPYHWDFLAAHMPQHLNDDPSDDLPLDQDPAEWLPGHPGADAFASYGRLDLTLTPDDSDAVPDELHDKDAKAWDTVQQSAGDDIHLRWIPGTKVIGAVTFSATDGYASGSHGVGSSSVSVGNLYGSCPHCLLVFVHGTQEQANEWVAKQDWIDAQTNSWGISSNPAGLPRDRVYAGSDTELQRTAIERGQQIFFSAGNGLMNDFSAPNPTLFSSQEGPDWIVTVGAITPDGDSYTGHGKPADVASVGSQYPSAYGSTTVTGEGGFGGTSNATPVTTGLYGEALYQLRRELTGASRTQSGGTIAVGPPGCMEANPACALSDGALTVHELREALYRAAQYVSEGYDAAGATGPIPANPAELRFLAEGHGSFWGLMQGPGQHKAEVDRIAGYANGSWFEAQDADQAAWFAADAACRQAGWGAWDFGYRTADAPAPDPAWPMRSWLTEACPILLPASIDAVRTATA